jgi:hypothetical protein
VGASQEADVGSTRFEQFVRGITVAVARSLQ